MTTLTSTIKSNNIWLRTDTLKIGKRITSSPISYILELGSGTGVGQVNEIWHDSRNINGTDILELTGLIQNKFDGNIIVDFGGGNIKAVFIDSSGSISGTAELLFSNHSGTISLDPSGQVLVTDSSGWAINNNDTIKITFSSATPYNMVLAGVTGI